MHIGLIGGIGPAATDFYYRGLIDRHAAAGIPLDATIVHADVREMSRNLAERRADRQAETFARLVHRLKAAGAQAAAITSMGGHICIKELIAISPLPMVHGLLAVDAAIAARGLRRVGIIGTRNVMESGLYGAITAAEVVAPEGAERDRVHQCYSSMAMIGRVTDEQREVFFAAGRKLHRERGAETVLLGGTDLFLAFTGQDCGFPTVDCADVHVEAIFRQVSSV
ncbi:MAG: aspartate/glutamate racemase family protein [Alphaproteobacteria bacterium]|nr:aspartate/glutamate racemase family protein [Alphaproteobacteria bacterium]